MIVGLSTATTRREAPATAGADTMTIEEVVRQVMVQEHGDVVRAAVEAVFRELMEGEVSELIGAERGERRPEDRMTHRNGYGGAALKRCRRGISVSEHRGTGAAWNDLRPQLRCPGALPTQRRGSPGSGGRAPGLVTVGP